MFSLFVLSTLGYYLDKPAWITIFAYEIVELIRFTRLFVSHNQGQMDNLIELMSWTKYIVWIVHAYFVVAMKEVHSKITCESAGAYQRMSKSDQRVKYIMFTLAGVYGVLKLARWIYVI